MADATKVKTTTQKAKTETETVVRDTAEGFGIAAILSTVWKYAQPSLIEIWLHLKERGKAEFNINRGSTGRSMAMMEPKKRSILLARFQKAIDEKTNTHFMSLISKFTPNKEGSNTDLYEALADMNEVEFNAMLTSQDDKVAQWIHRIRTDGRQMFKDDLGFVADAARTAGKHLGKVARDVDVSAGQLAPRVHAFAEELRNRRLGISGTTTRFTNTPTAPCSGERQKGDWTW